MKKSLITTHVLDTAKGFPAAGVPIALYRLDNDNWVLVDSGETDSDGRIMKWSVNDAALQYGTYKMKFNLSVYLGEGAFYPFAEIVFRRQDDRHHHIPLLLSPFGYSTYRGS
ncbi:MAG: hydroxyisourate hydrolase [Reinekea sp.]|jgi:5-hydroxyisourate hydrolase